eukprot:8169583-Alexandrium_andersonii.AAC.1
MKIVRAIDKKAPPNVANEIMLSLGPRRDLDPRAYAFAERVVAFRRMWHKQPQRQSIIRGIWRAYCVQGHPGCKGPPNSTYDALPLR